MNVVWTQTAIGHLASIHDYIANDSPRCVGADRSVRSRRTPYRCQGGWRDRAAAPAPRDPAVHPLLPPVSLVHSVHGPRSNLPSINFLSVVFGHRQHYRESP